MRKFGVSGRG